MFGIAINARINMLLITLIGNGNGTALATDGYVRTRAAVIEPHKCKSPLNALYDDTSRPPSTEAPAKGAPKAKGRGNTQSQTATLLAEAVIAPSAAAAPAAASFDPDPRPWTASEIAAMGVSPPR